MIVVFAVIQMTGQRLPGIATAISGASSLCLVALGIWQISSVRSEDSDLQRINNAFPKTTTPIDADPFGLGSSLNVTSHASIGPGVWLVIAAGLAAAVMLLVGWLTRRPAAGS